MSREKIADLGSGAIADRGSGAIAVLGAGAFGGWTALSLLRRGAAVTLVDPWGPGNARASSGGESRVIRTIYGDSAIYSRWALRAGEIWRESDAEWGTQLYQPMPVLWLCGHDDAYVREALPHLETLGVRADRLSLADLATRFPQVDTAEERPAQDAGGGQGARPVDLEGSRGGKLLSPARRREAVAHVRGRLGVSERRACRVLKQPRTTHRYVPKEPDDEQMLTERIVDLARQYGRAVICATKRFAVWNAAIRSPKENRF